MLGNIDVAHVFRLQVDGTTDANTGAITGGMIQGNITATTQDNSDFTRIIRTPNPDIYDYFSAITYVRAGRAIRGTITATGDESLPIESRRGSISKIIVGPSPNAEGITGDIMAPTAKIGSIFTTGPIGKDPTSTEPAVTPKIYAGRGIQEIRAVNELDAGEPSGNGIANVHLPRLIRADLRSNVAYDQNNPPDVPRSSSDVGAGNLSVLRTAGSIKGEIRASNVSTIGPEPSDDGRKAGIYAAGDIEAPISIDFALERAAIIGKNLLGPINIGLYSYASPIVAHGRDDQTAPNQGEISSVTIGYRPDPLPDHYRDLLASRPRGLLGTTLGPIPAPPWYFRDGILDRVYSSEHWLLFRDLGQGVIRGRTIELCKLRAIRVGEEEKYPPRVEGIIIHNLQIDDLRVGAVWSGEIEWEWSDYGGPGGSNFELNDPTNDYASILQAEVGCIGFTGHVWFQDCPRFVVRRGLYGGLHVPSLPSSQAIWIGDRLGDSIDHRPSELCDCYSDVHAPPLPTDWCENREPFSYVFTAGTEYTIGAHRDVWFPEELQKRAGPPRPHKIDRGLIEVGMFDEYPIRSGVPAPSWTIQTSSNLAGQVIINRNNMVYSDTLDPPIVPNNGPAWTGDIRIKTHADLPPRDLSDQQLITSIFHAPWYNALPPQLGMATPNPLGFGAAGLAPFHLHLTACTPPVDPSNPDQLPPANVGVLESEFSSDAATPVVARFYGPIKGRYSSIASSVVVEAANMAPGMNCVWTSVNDGFRVRTNALSDFHTTGRTIALSRAIGMQPKPGVYRLRPIMDVDDNDQPTISRIVCKDVLGSPAAVWPTPCNMPSFVFRILPDCDGNHVYDATDIANGRAQSPPIERDANNNGVLDSCEGNPCAADFNQSGRVDVQDIFDFLNAWFAGLPSADFNGGGLSVQDIFDFLNAWFSAGAVNCPQP